jgi:hypothetical protein
LIATPVPTLNLGFIFPNPEWVLLGTLLAILGGVLAYLFVRGELPILEPRFEVWPWPPARPVAGFIALLPAVACYMPVLVHALEHEGTIADIALLACATGLSGLALHYCTHDTYQRVEARKINAAWPGWVFILCMTAGYIALNMHDIGSWRYAWIGDEWPFYDFARSLMHGYPADMLSQAGVYGIFPVVNSAYQALFLHLLGASVSGWRLESVLAAALPLVPLYWLALQLGGAALAVAASMLYASCDLLWAFAHIGYNNNDALLVMVPAAALLYAGRRANDPVMLFAAGVACGAGWYTIYTARLMIGILGLVLLTELRADLAGTMRRIGLLVAGWMVVVLPLCLDSGLDVMRQMSHNTPGDLGNNPYSLLLPQDTVRALYEFFYSTGADHYMSGSIFTPVSGAALLVGIAVAFRQRATLGARLLLIWFFVTLLLTTPFSDSASVAYTRSMIVVPAAALLGALGLCATIQQLASRLPRWWRQGVITTALLVALAVSLMNSADRFYNRTPLILGLNEADMLIGALQARPNATTIVVGQIANPSLCIMFPAYGLDQTRILHFREGLLTPLCSPGPLPATVSSGSLQVLIVDVDLKALAPCKRLFQPVLFSPNGFQAIYSMPLPAPAGGGTSFFAHVAGIVAHTCPSLPGFAP